MASEDFKDLLSRTVSDKVLRDEHLALLKIQYLIDKKEVLIQRFTNFLKKSLLQLNDQRPYLRQLQKASFLWFVVLRIKICQTKNALKYYTKQLSENLKNEKYTHLLWAIFGVLILPIFNQQVNLIKEFVFYYALLIFLLTKHGLFL